MKKILIAVVAAGLMVTGAMAVEGTITKIETKSDGSVKVILEKTAGGNTGKVLDGTPEANKAMLAVALTAKSTGATVDAYNDGTKWTNITIK